VRTLLGGICGTDLAILRQKQPIDSILPSYSSMPMLFGHENVAVVERTGSRVDGGWIGKRVCVEPTLHCGVRGIEPPCPRCRAGQFGACENFGAEGAGTSRLPAGTSIGYNRRTGGSYGEFFVAHQSQLVEAPAELADEELVLTDPAACSLHAVLRANLDQAEQILVYGGGVIGLTTVAGLRALGYGGRIDVVERSDFAGTWAEPMGANRLLRLPPGERQRFEAVAAASGGTVRRSRFSRCMLNGGYDIVFECVGSSRSIDESLKWTRARGQVILVGTDAGRRVDLTPIWFRELTIRGVYGRQQEEYQDRRIGTYQLTHELMVQKKLRLGGLLTHRYPVRQYKEAFTTALNKDAHRAMKVAFDFREHKG
ncbi:MAG: alcohol dehydrogenase catalytic domain-containing protein, partial [Sedimentisphaerales bacterium]|nr:alcohol dehydrogenase catalytic domain-containing protein [Sedimentisphaerales bacterium]